MKLSNKNKIVIFASLGLVLIVIAVFISMKEFNSLSSQQPELRIHTPGITLKQAEVIIHIGDSFDAKEYVVSAYDDEGNDCINLLIIDEWLSTEFEAEYEVDYIVKNEKGFFDQETLKVIVQE